MNGTDRKSEIYRILSEKDEPVSASVLAEIFGVTRQIIVKDIALLKAEKKEILSTSKGYLIDRKNGSCSRTIRVNHKSEDIENEMNIIVDLGGKILTTSIEHPIYGTLGETLNVKSRKDVKNFLSRISESKCEPLLKLTNGIHTHVIEAEDEQTLDEICEVLAEKEYLIF